MSFIPPAPERLAVIDLGTNTFHLLIAEVLRGQPPRFLHREKQAVKLGMGGINQSVIRPEAASRGIACLQNFRRTIDQWNVSRIMSIGTSALRSASNGKEVAAAFAAATGIDITIIDGDREAEYIYEGIRASMDLGADPALLIDIGGGSVEFIIGTAERSLWRRSIETGGQRMVELFHREDPINATSLAALTQHFDRVLIPVLEALRQYRPSTLVGSSGTFDTMSEIFCARTSRNYNGEDPETPLTWDGFREIHTMLVTRNRAERMQIPGMIEMRVDMIVVASCLIDYIAQLHSFNAIRVSTWSLKEGVLIVMANSEPGGKAAH